MIFKRNENNQLILAGWAIDHEEKRIRRIQINIMVPSLTSDIDVTEIDIFTVDGTQYHGSFNPI